MTTGCDTTTAAGASLGLRRLDRPGDPRRAHRRDRPRARCARAASSTRASTASSARQGRRLRLGQEALRRRCDLVRRRRLRVLSAVMTSAARPPSCIDVAMKLLVRSPCCLARRLWRRETRNDGARSAASQRPGRSPPLPRRACRRAEAARPGARKATKVRSVEGITEYRLDNGLQVLLFPDPTQSTVTVNITYLVGSRHEGYGETGMAHLLEHMMFKGTPRHRNVLKLLEESGGQVERHDVDSIARTTSRRCRRRRRTSTARSISRPIACINASISPDDLKTEFSVVRNEFEMGENDPQRVLDERIVVDARTSGTTTARRRSARAPTSSACRSRRCARSTRSTTSPTTRCSSSPASSTTRPRSPRSRRLFGAIAEAPRACCRRRTRSSPCRTASARVTLRRNGDVHVDRPRVSHASAGSVAGLPRGRGRARHADARARGPALQEARRDQARGERVRLDSRQTHDPYARAVHAAGPRREERRQGRADHASHEVEGLGASKIDDKELERWRAATLKEIELAIADSQEIAVELSEFAALGDWRTLFAYRDRVKKVTIADVQRVAKTYFKASNRTVGRFIPTKDADRAPLTETPDVAAATSRASRAARSRMPGEVFAATLDNIEAAHDAQGAQGRHQGGAAAEEDARRQGRASPRSSTGATRSRCRTSARSAACSARCWRAARRRRATRTSRTSRISSRRRSGSRAAPTASRSTSRRCATSSPARSISRPRC